MASDPIRVHGARELRAALKKAGVGVQDLKKANQAVGELIARKSVARAPRRTGRLAGSARAGKAASRAQVLVGRAAVPYAGPIHWGWEKRGITAQPWIRETAQDTEVQWLRQYQDAIDDLVRTVERST